MDPLTVSNTILSSVNFILYMYGCVWQPLLNKYVMYVMLPHHCGSNKDHLPVSWSWLRAVDEDMKPLNFSLVKAWRKPTNRNDCHRIVDTAIYSQDLSVIQRKGGRRKVSSKFGRSWDMIDSHTGLDTAAALCHLSTVPLISTVQQRTSIIIRWSV